MILDILAWLVIGAACVILGAIIVPLFVRTVLFIVALVEWLYQAHRPRNVPWYPIRTADDYLKFFHDLNCRAVIEEGKPPTDIGLVFIRVPFWRVSQVKRAIEDRRMVCVGVRVSSFTVREHIFHRGVMSKSMYWED